MVQYLATLLFVAMGNAAALSGAIYAIMSWKYRSLADVPRELKSKLNIALAIMFSALLGSAVLAFTDTAFPGLFGLEFGAAGVLAGLSGSIVGFVRQHRREYAGKVAVSGENVMRGDGSNEGE